MNTPTTPAPEIKLPIDRVIAVMGSLVTTLALSIGGWYFSTLQTSIGLLRGDIADLKTKIAVLEVSRVELESTKAQLLRLEDRLYRLEQRTAK